MNNNASIIPQTDAKLLQVLENIKKSIAEIDDIKELQDTRNMADGFETAWKKHYRSSGFGLEQMFLGWEAKVRSERRMGEMLGEMELKEKRLDNLNNSPKLHSETSSLDDLGISKIQSHRYQLLARIAIKDFEKKIEELRNAFNEPTTSILLKMPFVGENRGQYEWYTPPKFIDAATKTMGEITTDPASCDKANEIVKAKKFFTELDNGLTQEWEGNVWLNPPFAQPLIDDFSKAVVNKYESKEFMQGCIFVNNATETAWFQRMLKISSAVCFIKGRVKCLDTNLKELEDTGPLQGQVVIYIGKDTNKFEENFKEFGTILWHKV